MKDIMNKITAKELRKAVSQLQQIISENEEIDDIEEIAMQSPQLSFAEILIILCNKYDEDINEVLLDDNILITLFTDGTIEIRSENLDIDYDIDQWERDMYDYLIVENFYVLCYNIIVKNKK